MAKGTCIECRCEFTRHPGRDGHRRRYCPDCLRELRRENLARRRAEGPPIEATPDPEREEAVEAHVSRIECESTALIAFFGPWWDRVQSHFCTAVLRGEAPCWRPQPKWPSKTWNPDADEAQEADPR